MDTTIKLRMWNGVPGQTLENPSVELLQHFLDRKQNIFTPLTAEGADLYLRTFKMKTSPKLEWFIGTDAEWEAYKAVYPILKKADAGQLMDDISIWHTVFSETLIKILIFKYSTEAGKRVRVKVISDVIAKYNLDLVIKDFKPDYIIPENDKLKLIDGLKEVEAYDDGIYSRLSQSVGLEATAIHNEVVDAYERIIQSIHQTVVHQIDGNTLAGELANAGGHP